MKVSFIATVYNEEETIKDFLKSLFSQSRMPDEIVIVDGGSTDNTLSVISNFQMPRLSSKRAPSSAPISKNKVKIIVKKGNRSVGRNEAIKSATNEIIVCSDAGCTLDKNWVKNIVKPFEDPNVDVVAGYYKGDPGNIFQKSLVPYVLVMPDKVNNNFLPATRSMAFRKSIWKKVGRFPEEFSNNEDYVFAKKLEKANVNIVFEKSAIVYWRPRNNIKDAFIMFYRFAKGDSEALIFRPKVALIFVRYVLFFLLLFFALFLKSNLILVTFCLSLVAYILWSIIKNYKYVKNIRVVVILPLIQLTSDKAVMIGTVSGLLSARLKVLFEALIYISAIYLTILLNFRQLRSLFPPPKIAENGIAGYAHYFGYPLYFETIIFFIFILSPITIIFILSKIRKY